MHEARWRAVIVVTRMVLNLAVRGGTLATALSENDSNCRDIKKFHLPCVPEVDKSHYSNSWLRCNCVAKFPPPREAFPREAELY